VEETDVAEVDISELFSGVHVDTEALAGHVLKAVAASPSGQANLAAIVDGHPLTLGLAELLAYFQVEHPGLDMIVDPDRTDLLVYPRVHAPGRTQAPRRAAA
jgi:hypothetical protein